MNEPAEYRKKPVGGTITVEAIAKAAHEANRVLQEALGEEPNRSWETCDQELRDSAVDGVRNVMSGATPEDNHENWLRFKTAAGWTFGPEKDFQAKTHPCMVPYDELPPDQQVKDHLFSAIVTALAPLVLAEIG